LLDILSGRKSSGNISGTILINGSPVNMNAFRQDSAYVMQDDLLYSFLTVKEILLFTADLKITSLMSKLEKLILVFLS
jgi:ATP-binding cassette subfamily G (WHITE) protein 2